MRGTPEVRFWSKVDKSGECWLWTAGVVCGYGSFYPTSKAPTRAHRFSYELSNGPVPAGMFIDHICRNKLCVRPSHLRPVTVKQNMENRGRANTNSGSGVQGVYWHKTGRKWCAQVQHNGKKLYLGLFESLDDAEAAARAKRNELFTHNDADR